MRTSILRDFEKARHHMTKCENQPSLTENSNPKTPIEISRVEGKGWFIRTVDGEWGPSNFLPSHMGEPFKQIVEELEIPLEKKSELARAIVKTRITINEPQQENRANTLLDISEISLPDIVWAENHTIHPSLDFDSNEAYVTVPLLIQEIVSDKRGDEIIKKVKKPIVITSSRKCFEANIETFRDLNLDVEKLPIVPGLRWSKRSIQAYFENKIFVDKIHVFNEIFSNYRMFIDFSEPETYNFISLWSLGTYFFPLFETYPYIYFGGLKRSGKTKTLTLTSLITFNAIFSSNMTSSSLFRLIENARSTLLIDETEGLNDPRRKQDFRSILLAGYKKGSLVYRTHKDKHVPEGFEVYSPKMIANIRGLEDVLEDRCIAFILLTTTNHEIGNREVKTQDDKWQAIRDNLYVLLLTSWKEITQIYERLKNDTGLSDRNWELWKPILTLARWMEIPDLYHEMMQLALRKTEEKRIENVTETGEAVLVSTLLKLVKNPGYYKVKEIKDVMTEQYAEEQKWLNNRWIGRVLGRLGFKDKRRLGTGIEYKLTRVTVLNLAERLGLNPSEVCEVNEVSEVPRDSNKEQSEETSAYSLTTQTTLKEPLLGDLIPCLRKSFHREEFHLENFWIDRLKDYGCSQERAEVYFKDLKGTFLFYGDEGWAIG